MFKRTFLALLIAMPLCVFAQKFGVVSMQTLVENMPEYTSAMKELEAKKQKYDDDLRKMGEEIELKGKEYEAMIGDTSTPDAIKQRRQKEIEDMVGKYQQNQQNFSDDLMRQQQMLSYSLQNKIIDAVKAVGQEGGYVFIFPEGVTVYQGPMVEDITPAVAERLGITLTHTAPQQ